MSKGWHSRGYLPHFDSPEIVQFITFNLADGLPAAVSRALRLRQLGVEDLDSELDTGRGACWLGRSEIASFVQDALLHFDGDRFVIELRDDHTLGAIVRSWKSFTARKANEFLKRAGEFWHADYFDRFMRNEEHLAATMEYVEQNPVKARLVSKAEDWAWSSAALRK